MCRAEDVGRSLSKSRDSTAFEGEFIASRDERVLQLAKPSPHAMRSNASCKAIFSSRARSLARRFNPYMGADGRIVKTPFRDANATPPYANARTDGSVTSIPRMCDTSPAGGGRRGPGLYPGRYRSPAAWTSAIPPPGSSLPSARGRLSGDHARPLPVSSLCPLAGRRLWPSDAGLAISSASAPNPDRP